MTVPMIAEEVKDKNYKHLRLRELKRDYMFGPILKGHDRTLKSIHIPDSHNLVLQILNYEEQLGEDDIVLIVKSRDSEKRLYRESHELIFKAPKVPKLIDLKVALLQWK